MGLQWLGCFFEKKEKTKKASKPLTKSRRNASRPKIYILGQINNKYNNLKLLQILYIYIYTTLENGMLVEGGNR